MMPGSFEVGQENNDPGVRLALALRTFSVVNSRPCDRQLVSACIDRDTTQFAVTVVARDEFTAGSAC